MSKFREELKCQVNFGKITKVATVNLVVALAILAWAGGALAEGEPDFSYWPKVQYSVELSVYWLGETESVLKEFVGSRVKRSETIAGEEIFVLIEHFQEDGVTSIVLDPGEKTYFSSFDTYELWMEEEDSEDPFLAPTLPGDGLFEQFAEVKNLGTETFLGRKVEKWSVHFYDEEEGETYDTVNWIDPEMRAVLKYEVNGEVIMEATKIKVGKQPSSLFEIPTDYSEMAF